VPYLENCDLAEDSRGKEVGKRGGGGGERGPVDGTLERHILSKFLGINSSLLRLEFFVWFSNLIFPF
jgi:hypothetical protein